MSDPLTIVLNAAMGYVDQIEGRQHADAVIAKGDRIRSAVEALQRPTQVDVSLARSQRDWLLRVQAAINTDDLAMPGDAQEQLDGIINLLDAILESLQGYSRALQATNAPTSHIYIVPRNTPEALRLYAFEDEDRAQEYADRHTNAVIYEEILMNHDAAGQFLINTAGEEEV